VPPPARPRWFDLDRLRTNDAPRLAAWVARTDDIQAAVAAAKFDPTTIERMTRGSFAWQITIPPDGGLPMQGCAPALIQWAGLAHPAALLPDPGCRLLRLEVRHPESAELARLLDAIGFDGPLEAAQAALPSLSALIQTPMGAIRLGTV
jgi:hypothetical protein